MFSQAFFGSGSMQSSRLMPMVTVRTSRLSCVNISMVSRMSPVLNILIAVYSLHQMVCMASKTS